MRLLKERSTIVRSAILLSLSKSMPEFKKDKMGQTLFYFLFLSASVRTTLLNNKNSDKRLIIILMDFILVFYFKLC